MKSWKFEISILRFKDYGRSRNLPPAAPSQG